MKINGNTVGTPIPRSNYNQTDPKKADYLVGRENIVGKDNLASVTEEILAQAKASGEFNGSDGKDGYTPVKGTDYFTEEDKAEIAEQAAGLVEIPEGGGGNSVYFSEEEPTDAKTGDFWYDESEDETSQLSLLIETDMLPAVYNADGKILTDENGKIILRY